MCSWTTHLTQQSVGIVNSLKAFIVLTDAGERQCQRALRGDLGRQVGRSERCGSDEPKHFDCFSGPIGMKRTQCFAPQRPDLLLRISATLGAGQKSLRGLFERAPVAAVELRPEANDLRPAPTQLVTSLRTKFLRLIYPTINYRPIAATDTPQGV